MFSYLFVCLFVLAIVALGVTFLFLIKKNMKQGFGVREAWARRIQSLPMSRMLAAVGIDFDSYLHRVPLSKINESMNNCEHCDTLEQCEQQLAQPTTTTDDIGFCPNQECLTRFKGMQEQENQPTA